MMMMKLFEVPISLASLYVVARTVCLCGAKHATQSVWTRATTFMVLSSLLEKTIQSVWKLEQWKR